ncbi:glycine--tRNA ligase [Candidatus Uhrbacteria bacterium RIFCSPLOWO2_02_FULL_51_9]|uniref:Glycine--tRNA ligase n=1 Tax=Candidatus Uhrbacteria bacterium RIFCSPLOWO2_02_FULL_51_9 TaxID=1802410 RepID=A0A1F7VH12_9BACT|nr:MAG: glycine--tRNA ligase [Candidatus Uhrbacteria bacterium RIFCSPLOWO2_02_FULL_51_9]
MEKIVSLCKRRGFIFPGSEIYGGMANSWDYGPLGVEMKNNIKQEWWKRFVRQRPDVVGIDAALIMNPKVWEASGHLKNFTDPLVDCKKCKQRFRADSIPDDHAKTCGGELTNERQFNLMFKTFIGPAEESANIAYFRPETAQAMFVDFKNVLQSARKRLPFGIAQIGKAFRNEITPGNFIFRTREFEQMEIEYFIREQDWEKSFEMWHEEMLLWVEHIGIPREKMHLKEVEAGERAHYSKRTVDFEYPFPFGVDELYGLAYRTDFDLKNHAAASGQDLSYVDAETNEKVIPHVIEPTWGVDRTMLAALCAAYHEEEAPTAEDGKTEARVVLRLPKWLAPIKVAILPLSKKDVLSAVAEPLYRELAQQFFCEYDETQSIGKRYRRQDEIGTPYCVTVDFESLEDKAVTIRDRDTMKQERVPLAEVKNWLVSKL